MAIVLLKAVSAGRPRQVRLLLDSGISTEVSDECGQTALIRAVFIDHVRSREKIVKMLLKYGAQVSTADIVGRNALSWACLYGRDRDIQFMLEGADVNLDLNQADMKGQTALFHAATCGSAAAVKLMVDALKKYDLNVDVPNHSGLTPLMQAFKLGHDVCASILIQHGNAKRQFDPATIAACDQAKWATKSTKDDKASSVRKNKHSQFPPIIPTGVVQKIQYRENKARQLSILTPIDSDDDSMYCSASSQVSDDTLASVYGDVSPVPKPCRSKRATPDVGSVRTISKTSSTEANADSDSDDGVDCFSTPFRESKPSFRPTRDLHHLYRIYEEQSSSSHRPGAAKPKLCPSNANDTDDSHESGFGGSPRDASGAAPPDTTENTEGSSHGYRKKDWRSRLRSSSNRGGAHFSKFPPPPPTRLETSSSSDSDISEKVFAPRKALFPRILGKTVSLVQTPRDEKLPES